MVKTRTTDYSSNIVWKEGYKGFNYDMTAYNNFQFEIGQTYHHQGSNEIQLCRSGFHFCRKLNDVFDYYDIQWSNKYRYCLIEYDSREGKVIHENNNLEEGKSVTSSIRIVRELSEEEIRELSPFIKVWRYEKKESHREEYDEETGQLLPSVIMYHENGNVLNRFY